MKICPRRSLLVKYCEDLPTYTSKAQHNTRWLLQGKVEDATHSLLQHGRPFSQAHEQPSPAAPLDTLAPFTSS